MAQLNWESSSRLFDEYRGGDAAAADAFLRGTLPTLQRYFSVRTGSASDAEDLAQATLLKIHLARHRFDGSRSLKTWVFTIASRVLIDMWRSARSAREELAAPAEPDDQASELPSHGDALALQQELARAIESLKPLERTVVHLYGVEQMSITELAEALGISEAAAKARAHRAYARLRAELEVSS
jgi:RNA polymerase sigma-70 factor (ECF subfamily)